MLAMMLKRVGSLLELTEAPMPIPSRSQLLLKVLACGVCRTDLHIVDGELAHPALPLIPGHEIVGRAVEIGADVKGFQVGDRVGVGWLGRTDGTCIYCRTGRENLCDHPLFTGYSFNGGYAEYTVAESQFCYPLPASCSETEIAPWLCAGLIGYRSYRMTGVESAKIGFYGFGAAAHLLTQLAVYEGKQIYAFTKPGDRKAQEFALKLGAVWAGPSDGLPPEKLDAAVIFAPAGALLPAALRATAKGGIVICGGIHMSDIPSFPYSILWEERSVRSVANLTREDALGFLEIAPKVPIKAVVAVFPLAEANEALKGVRAGSLEGAAVLKI
jgi:propanol-preferring alcohol dehydrogenase